MDGELRSDQSGYSVAGVGDINEDGIDDLLIGAIGSNNYAGCSYILFGGSTVGGNGLFSLSALDGKNGFKLDGEGWRKWLLSQWGRRHKWRWSH